MSYRLVFTLYAALGLSGFALLYVNTWLSRKARQRGGERAHWLLGWTVNGLGMIAIGASWLLLSTLGPRWDWPVLSWLGLASGAAGGGLFLFSAVRVGRIKRPSRYSIELDTSGVYSVVRHPQALALSLLAMGLAGLTRSVPLLLTLPIWVGCWYLYTRLEEELELIPAFGTAYREYRKETPGLLPDPRRLVDWLHHAREERTVSSR